MTEGTSVAVGSTFWVKFKPFMGQSEGTLTVSEYEPLRRVVFKGRMGKLEPIVMMTVEPDGGGSRITRRVEMDPPGLMRLLAPFTGGMMRKSNAGFLANLKRVLEPVKAGVAVPKHRRQ